MKTVLVAGGAGFIGSCFVRQWANATSPALQPLQSKSPAFQPGQDAINSVFASLGSRLVNLDKLTYAGNLDSLMEARDHSGYVLVEGDICDRALLAEVFETHRPWAVVNFAAESHVDRSIEAPSDFIRTNVLGTCELLAAARAWWSQLAEPDRSQFRLLHVSTDEVYGSLGESGAFSELSRYAPNSPYAASKAAADHFARAYHHTYGLPVLTTNCSNNYGPYQFPEKLIPLMILNALEGKPLPVYGDGLQIRDWLFVEDHCEALCTVLLRGTPGEVYNIGGNCERTNLDVVRAICNVVDQLCPGLPHLPCGNLITYVTDRPGHDRRYAIDASKIRRELDWRPRHEFESGLEATVRWYLENPTWVQRVTKGTYARDRRGLTAK